MTALLAMVGLAMGGPRQEPGHPVVLMYPGVESGSVHLLDGQGGKKVWEFKVKGRKGFLDMLAHLHSRDTEVYEVAWGTEDVLRIDAHDSGGDDSFYTLLRLALNPMDMTYRVTGGVISVVPRPIPIAREENDQSDYWLRQRMLGNRSLDSLARFLASIGRGYRVDHAAGKAIWLTAPFVNWNQLKWIVSELDPGLAIDDRHKVVVIKRR